MSRPLRIEFPDAWYHVMNRARLGQDAFPARKDFRVHVTSPLSEHLLEAAIGMANINSLLEFDRNACVERNAAELILEKGAGKRIAIVGQGANFRQIMGTRKLTLTK